MQNTLGFAVRDYVRSALYCPCNIPKDLQPPNLRLLFISIVYLAKFDMYVCVLDFMTLLMMIPCLQMLYTFHTDTRSAPERPGWERLTYEALTKKIYTSSTAPFIMPKHLAS